jgi:excisionase family DNA binding protein
MRRHSDVRDVLTSTEAGALLGVSAATVKRWSDEGALPSIRTRGGHRRFRRADVEDAAARLRSNGSGQGTLAERLMARESALLVQAELLAERARSGSWQGVIDLCVSTLRSLANAQRASNAAHLGTRIAHAVLTDALARCSDELPTPPGAPGIVIAAVQDEPFTVPLALARLAARAAGWRAWCVGAVPTAEVAHFASAHASDAVLLFASIARPHLSLEDDFAALEEACGASGVAFAATGAAPWPPPRAAARVLRSLSEVGGWLAEVAPRR